MTSIYLGSSELKKMTSVWVRGEKRAKALELDKPVSRLFFAVL